MPSPGKALSILDISQPEWKFDKRAFISVLRKCGDRKVAIYSINGPTRSGKSFLLNYFIRYFEEKLGNSEDQVGTELFKSESGLGRVTVGINLWSKPYFVQTEGEVAVLLLDTQGLFDQNTTYKQNAIIFTVSSLLSSVMMYNQQGLMTEDVLQNVERFSNFTNNIVDQRNLRVPLSSDFNIGAANSLLFLMRDFELANYKHGYHSLLENPRGSNQNFFKDILGCDVNDDQTGAGAHIEIWEENRLVRRQLQRMYPLLATYLLPHPGIEFIEQQIEIGNSNPRAKFQAEAQSFVERTVSQNHLVTKKIRGQVVTARRFKYCMPRIEAILREADAYFSDLTSMREYDAANQYFRVVNAASNFYKSELEYFISNHPEGVFESQFVVKHEEAFERALIKFDQESSYCIIDPVQRQKYRSKLETHLNSLFHQLQNINTRNRKRTKRNKQIKNVAIGVVLGVGALAVVGTAIVLTGPVGVVTVIAAAEGAGAGVAATGAGAAATGAGVAATGAGAVATGVGVAATGAGVTATGAGVAATGAGIVAAGASVTTRVIVSKATVACVAVVGAGIAAACAYSSSNTNTTHLERPNRT